MDSTNGNRFDRPFRFHAMWWINHADFENFKHNNWRKVSLLIEAISSIIPKLKEWNKTIFGNVFQRKKELMARIRGIQTSPQYFSNSFLQNHEIDLRNQLDSTLKHEEMLWFQKSRKDWIQGGDRNTKYYHSRTISRRRKNRILSLQDDSGEWSFDDIANKNRVKTFFINLYTDDFASRPDLICRLSYPRATLITTALASLSRFLK
ncbi:hypothetical protein RIF29_39916 [Crotalaria pallida]|uniref:Uncharacterized protein n=1 Tax=Crotalaria pallida TaxID=3830 RepID=A0AAN9E254_CROPI